MVGAGDGRAVNNRETWARLEIKEAHVEPKWKTKGETDEQVPSDKSSDSPFDSPFHLIGTFQRLGRD